MRIAYLDISFGISGDMVLGALVDAGADADALVQELGKLNVTGWELSFEKVRVQGLAATRATVTKPHGHDGHGHGHGMSPGQLIDIIEESGVAEGVKQRSVEIVRYIAEAEAGAHGVRFEDVHFHELGGLDTVIDVVGSVVGLDLLGVDELWCSPLPVSHGFADTEHGRLPVPVPAVVGLLKGVPTRPLDVAGETVTPTGAAIATVLSSGFGPLPAMKLLAAGFGAGQKDFPGWANLLRIMVGESAGMHQKGTCREDEQVLLEANIDDMNPELYGPAQDAIFSAGAVDCWFTPIFMKKNRPAIKLSALAAPEKADAVTDAMLLNTTTFGVRRVMTRRQCLQREMRDVDTAYGVVRVKLGIRGGTVITTAPEFADCQQLAAERGVPVKLVYQAAVAAAENPAEPS